MAYTNFTNCTAQQYKEAIYNGESSNRIRIWFNNVELQDADEYCISLEGTNRIFPNDGAKRISLDNFVSREYTLTLRDLPEDAPTITDQVRISIGTLVDSENNTWEDVPIGIFNIQDKPETDQNKITIKLRDNRVRFDFGYNAKPLMDLNDGTATYIQILNDICTQAGVTSDVSSFAGQSIAVGIYDNTITATTYVSYIAEQAGAIPIITREGHLDFIYLNDLDTWKIPLDIVEKYEIGKEFQIKRVVYESGTIKFQTSNDDTLETLYLDANNMYISTQSQVDSVFDLLEDVTIGSGITGKIIGNPAIDSWDLISLYGYYEEDEEGNSTFIDDENTIVFTTIANNTYKYTGVNINTFETLIGEEERKENVTITGEGVFRKWAKSEINNVNGTITNIAGDIQDITVALEGYYTLTEDITFEDKKDYYVLTNDTYEYYPQYYITPDTTYQSGVQYYVYDDATNTYTLFTNYNVGDEIQGDKYNKNYSIGDSITANTYYEFIQSESLERRMSVAEEELSSQGLILTVKTSKIDSEGNSTSFISEGAEYTLTGDATFQDEKTYYILNNGEYVVATVTTGSAIPSNTYYEQSTVDTIRYELGKNGFITDDGNGFKAIRDASGDFYYDNNVMKGKYTKDGSVQKDMALFGRYYYGVEENVDVETFSKEDAMFMAEMYEGNDGNGNPETGFGHFYNGS